MSLTALASEIETHIKKAAKFKVDAYEVYGRYLFKTVLVLTKQEGISCLSEAEPENDYFIRMIDMYQVGALCSMTGLNSISNSLPFLAIYAVILVGVSLGH